MSNILDALVKQCLMEVLSERKNQDPTREEMITFLQQQFGREDGFEEDAEVAMYWFANFNHSGQWSNLYSILSTSQFRPGPMSSGPQPGSSEEMMFQSLESEFGYGEETGEVDEVNYDNGEDGKPVMAVGAPNSLERIKVKFPKAIRAFAVLLNQYPDRATQDAIIAAARAMNTGPVKETSQPEPHDAETDTFQPSPRDRTEPSSPQVNDIPSQMMRQSMYKDIRRAEAARKINPKSWEELDAMPSGDLQRYLNSIGKFDNTVFVPGHGWGGVREAGDKPVNPLKLTNSERKKIGAAFTKLGLDGNGRFEKKEHGLSAITDALSSLGFQLNMVSGDTIMGDKGQRNLPFRRTNDPGADVFTDKPEIENSRIVFVWERLDGPGFAYPHAPSKFEILAYAS